MSGPYGPGPYRDQPGPSQQPGPGPFQPGGYPPPPRKLTRSRGDKFLGGVCGGVARYLNMDPTLVRVLWVVLSLVTSGAGLLVYLVMLFVVPEEDQVPPQVHGPGAPGWQPGAPAQGDGVWGAAGAPWEQLQPSSQPAPRPEETPRKGDDPVS